MLRRTWIIALAASALALPAASASAQSVLTFEDYSHCDNNTQIGVYNGVNFNQQFVCYSFSQDPYNASSGTNRAYTVGAGQPDNTATFSFSGPTTFQGAYFAGYGNTVNFDMYLNGSLVGSSGFLTTSSTPTFLSSGYNGQVDQVVVNGPTESFVIDDITYGGQVSTTPEPSSMALLGTGLVGLVPMVRRRRK